MRHQEYYRDNNEFVEFVVSHQNSMQLMSEKIRMSAMVGGGQTGAVKERPLLYKYVSYWTFPRSRWGDVDKENTTSNQVILAPALADGSLVGYGDDENQVRFAEGFTHANWLQASSRAGVMKVLEAFRKSGSSSSPLLASATRHWDQVFVSRFYNWKAGSWKGACGYKSTYKLKPDAPDADEALRILSCFYVPLFEELLAGGTIVEYEIDREIFHDTDSRARLHFSFVIPSAEGMDELNAALRAAIRGNSLIGPAFGSMMVNFTPQNDWVRVNATYK